MANPACTNMSAGIPGKRMGSNGIGSVFASVSIGILVEFGIRESGLGFDTRLSLTLSPYQFLDERRPQSFVLVSEHSN